MGVMMGFTYTGNCPKNKIGIIPNTNIMYYTVYEHWIYCFTNNLERIRHKNITIHDLDNMELLSHHFSDITYLCTNNNYDISQYKLITIQRQLDMKLSCNIEMVIKTYTHQTLKSYEIYHETFHKYKFFHFILCLDVVNIIFQIIARIEIDAYYYIKINKMYVSFNDDKFKRKLMNIVHDVSCSNI